MLLRGLIPVGYMPNPDRITAGGGLFILCNSVHDALSESLASPAPETAVHPSATPMPADHAHYSLVHHIHDLHAQHAHAVDPHDLGMPMPMTGGHHHDMGRHPADAPCVFAAVVALAAALAIVILVLQPNRHRGAWTLAAAQLHPDPKPPGAQPARGPPLPFS
ncbi:hypothetical protein [Nitrospirillum amazonense]|uniref:hypothetical protein n=1 Tax=Nitrospirillum amazonense TaxID=28077 RepID=UPI0011A647C7|nr:hypothetical protein [Nitrospirillum amazonense]